MKKYLLIITIIFSACTGENNVTEMGNPKSHPSSIEISSAATTAVLSGAAGSFQAVAEGGKNEDDGEEYICNYDEEANSVTCDCDGGGTITKNFSGGIETSDGETTYSHTTMEVFNDCGVSTCGETIVLNGSFEADISGTFDAASGSDDMVIIKRTDQPDSGMKAGEENFGLEATITFDGLRKNIAGTLCVENSGDCFTFDSLDELGTLVDPDNRCPDGFSFGDDELDEEELDDPDEAYSEKIQFLL